MSTNQTYRKSLKTRLGRIVQVVVFTFVLLAIILFFVSQRVRSRVDQVVAGSLQRTIASAENSRDFSLLNARLNIFKATFDIDDQWYRGESEGVLADINDLQSRITDTELQQALERLENQFLSYLEVREWVNYLLFWRSEQDQDLDELLLLLREVIIAKMTEVTSSGGEALSLEQLLSMTYGLRESLFQLTKLNIEENPLGLLIVNSSDLAPQEIELTNLALQLKVLVAAEPPIDRLGRHLLSHLLYYQHRLAQYRQEMVFLSELDRHLNQNLAQILSAMKNLDQHSVTEIESTKLKIDKTILTVVTAVQCFLFLLGAMVWIYLRTFFKKHIQIPMALIGDRLTKFEQGDNESLLSLNRDDDWGEIEVNFNQMAATLRESVASLEESEQRYRNIFDKASDGMFRVTVSGKVLEVNRALVDLFGSDLPDNGIITENHEFFNLDLKKDIYCNPNDRDRWLLQLQQHEHANNFEIELKRMDGSRFWASLSGHLVAAKGDEEAYIDGLVHDISARKKAHDDLHQVQAYLQNIIDSMPSILIGVDSNMVVTLWNQRAAEESLLAAEDAQGYSMSTVCYLFDFSIFMPKLEETLSTGKPIWLRKVESIKKTKGGGKRFFDILIYPLSTNGADGAVIYMDDVTEKLQMEEMMVQSGKMQSIGGLAAGLAHEINNPLAVILQNVQVLERRFSPSLRKNHQVAEELNIKMEEIIEYVKLRGCEQIIHLIADAGHRVAKLVTNIQSFSRAGTYSLVPCPIADLLERTIELAASDYDMRNSYNFKDITIVRNYQPVPDVCCESSQIQQVFLSLLKNAAQALTERSDNYQITLEIVQTDDVSVRVLISDNGKGIAPEVVERIFDPFYTTQDVGAGFGLGLSTAYFIITHNHGGSLRVTSEVGVGSCFEVVLPIEKSVDEVESQQLG